MLQLYHLDSVGRRCSKYAGLEIDKIYHYNTRGLEIEKIYHYDTSGQEIDKIYHYDTGGQEMN